MGAAEEGREMTTTTRKRPPVEGITSDWQHLTGTYEGVSCDAWIVEDVATGYDRWLIRTEDGREYVDGGNFSGPDGRARAMASLLDALDADAE
jgi:hypothetical protein